jgi:hypothetical protein
MPDTLTRLAGRLAQLERRVAALERTRRQPYPAWRDLPLTGDTAIPDPQQPPQVRVDPWGTLEFSGRIGLPQQRAVDQAPLAVLPEGYWPGAPRTMAAASSAARRELQIEVGTDGKVTLLVQNGGSLKATWLSLDGVSCRLDMDDD